ncbi:MAG: HD domain-containing protein [Aquificae bacterium]|nr:HD domain-containing protein [Aquificota bacterium]
MKEFSDPLYGFIRLTDFELKLVDSLPFQRLRFIKQLGLAFLVFPSAHHTRFEHSLGTLFVTDLVARRLGFSKEERTLLRVAALLHDLGHPPFSHTTEELLPSKSHESFTETLVLNTELKELLTNELGKDGLKLVLRLALGKPADERERFLSSVITGQLGTDRLDYLRRDAYFCGVALGSFDYTRLLSTLTPVDGSIGVELRGLRALEDFFVSRYFMYQQVYFHKVVRILSLHLVEALKELIKEEELKDPSGFLALNDASVLTRLMQHPRARELTLGRRHFKEVFSTDDRERFLTVKKELLKLFPKEILRFDAVKKELYEEVPVVDGGKVYRASELSPLLSSLKPVETYRVYAERDRWREVRSAIERLS